MEAAKAANIFEEDCMAYRKGKGCDDITHLLVALKEDAIVNDQSITFIAEDEEKFFD